MKSGFLADSFPMEPLNQGLMENETLEDLLVAMSWFISVFDIPLYEECVFKVHYCDI